MAKQLTYENVNDSGVVRRPVGKAAETGDFDTQYLAHISHYEKAAQLMIEQFHHLDRPIRVLNLGCGEMWDLRVLTSTFWVSKSALLTAYIGMDIEPQVCPVGKKLEQAIGYEFIQQDFTVTPEIPFEDKSFDVVLFMEAIEHFDIKYHAPFIAEINRVMDDDAVLYVTTPNSDVRKMEKWHRYEYAYQELVDMLSKNWTVEYTYGIFIGMRQLAKAQKEHGRISEELIKAYTDGFGPNWLRIVLATPYPEYSEDVAYVCRKTNASS
jgi:SAM-dependent methyltransferase